MSLKTTILNTAFVLMLFVLSGACLIRAEAVQLDNEAVVPACIGSCAYKLSADALVDKEKGNPPLPLYMQVLIVEICAAGYGYWSAQDAGSYVAVSALASMLFGKEYMDTHKFDMLMPTLMFGAMAVRGTMIDNQKKPQREIEKTTFIDINVIMLTLGLAAEYFTRDKGMSKGKMSINFIPKSAGGVFMLSQQF